MTEPDYSEALENEFDMEVQSEAYDFNRTISIEVSTCGNHYKYLNDRSNEANVNIEFH